jgi:hypothetical protein
VRTIRFKTADLFEFAGAPRVQNPDFATITALVLKQFGFLPQLITVVVGFDRPVPDRAPDAQERRGQT